MALGAILIIVIGFFVSANSYASSYTLSLTSLGSQNIGVSSGGDKTAISVDNINVATTCRYGYNFTINTSVADNNLYLNGNSSNNQSDTYFTPSNGITSLKNSPNSWGYYYNNLAPTTAPTSSNIFNSVPALGNTATIKSPLAAPSPNDINDNFNIYYGVASSNSMPVGNYKMIPDANNNNNDGTIIYTATIADACLAYTVHYNPTGTNMGTSITGTDIVADQTIYEGITTNLTNSYFTGPIISDIQYYFLGWNTAQDGSGTQYTRGQPVTDLTTPGNTITLYAQWTDCPANLVCYSANATSGASGDMIASSLWSEGTSTTLSVPNYKYDNHGFVSWNTKADGTGTNYGPQETITYPIGKYNTGGLRLYANWIASNGNMQNWTGCSGMNIGDVTALKDTRDNNVYSVAKLADEKCWMIENLRLDDSVILSASNTNNPSLPLTNVYDTGLTSNHLSPTSSLAYDASTAPEGWCTSNSSACIDQSRLRTDNTVLYTNNAYSSGDNYRYGNYYNWYSATSGHGKYGSSYSVGYNAPGDICPAGWHLPKGGDKTRESNNEFWELIVNGINDGIKPSNYDNTATPSYTGDPEGTNASNSLRAYPNNFTSPGYLNGSSINNRSAYGYYWTTSARGTSTAHSMYFGPTYVYPGTREASKYAGYSVRCIFNQT